jgi:uncharacterized protein YjbI with pentapeptide repeats
MKPLPAKAPEPEREMTGDDLCALLADEDTADLCLVRGQQFEPIDFFKKDFQRCRFVSSRLTGCRFEKVQFSEVTFESCDLSGCVFTECSFHKVQWSDCKLVGTSMIECYCKDSLFDRVQARYANFSSAEFVNCRMLGSCLADAAFSQAKLRNFLSSDCDFHQADFSRAAINGTDWSASNISGALFSADGLKNVTVSPEQAMELALLLRIRIKQGG